MNKIYSAILALGFFCGMFSPLASAETVAHDGTIIKVTGDARVLLPGETETVALVVGMKIPQGATITTGNGEVFFQAHTGTIATIQANSTINVEQLSVTTEGGTVKRENTLLSVKVGNLISTIDPSKRAVNNYGVRTPKGVAAARGTSFSVSVESDGFKIAATADSVTFTNAAGTVFTISAGMISITPKGGTTAAAVSLAQAAKYDASVGKMVSDAVTALSTVIQSGGISADGAANVAAQVAGVSAVVSPSTAGQAAAQLATAAANSTSTTIAASSTSLSASVASAAAERAPGEAASIARQVVAATSSTNLQAAATVAAAVAKAAPGQANEIASSVASTVASSSPGNEVQVAATISASVAKASGADLTSVVNATSGATNTSSADVSTAANNSSTQTAATEANESATQATSSTSQAAQNITTPTSLGAKSSSSSG